MATPIAKADVSYSEIGYPERYLSGHPPRIHNKVTVVFGAGGGTKTYPVGGIPLDASKMGLPNLVIEDVIVIDPTGKDPATNPDWTFDNTFKKLRAYDPGSGAEISGAVGVNTLVLVVLGY